MDYFFAGAKLAMDDDKELSEWVQRALDHKQMKQAELSRALVQSGLRTIDRSAVNKVVLGTRKLSAEEMLEVSRITGYPIPDRRIGATLPGGIPMSVPEETKRVATKPVAPSNVSSNTPRSEGAARSDTDVNAQREIRLRILIAKFLEAQGKTAAVAERIAVAMLVLADMPQDPQSGALNPDQIQAEARVLSALFDQKHPV